MEKLFADSEEKYLKTVVMYADDATGDDANIYKAVGDTTAAPYAEVKDLCEKGLLKIQLVGSDGSTLGGVCTPVIGYDATASSTTKYNVLLISAVSGSTVTSVVRVSGAKA